MFLQITDIIVLFLQLCALFLQLRKQLIDQLRALPEFLGHRLGIAQQPLILLLQLHTSLFEFCPLLMPPGYLHFQFGLDNEHLVIAVFPFLPIQSLQILLILGLFDLSRQCHILGFELFLHGLDLGCVDVHVTR